MNIKKTALVVAGILGMFSISSQAALNIYTNSVESAQDVANAGNYEFNQHGLSSEEAMIVKGFGKEMPLDLSLQIIIPNDWKVNLNKSATKTPVDWKGKSTWPYVLENLAKDNNLQVTVDWSKRIVSVFSKEAEEKMLAQKTKEIKESEAKKVELMKASEKAAVNAERIRKEVIVEEKRLVKENLKLQEAKDYAMLEKKVIDGYMVNNPSASLNTGIAKIYKNANVLPLDKTEASFVDMTAKKSLKEYKEAYYILQEERMLSDNIEDWATANGWRLVWTAESDFRITNTIEKKATMLNMIDYTVGLYKKSKKPLMVKYYIDNKVVKVEDFNYEK